MHEQLSLLELPVTPQIEEPAIAHHCHAIGCNKSVQPKMLMCPQHWRNVPQHLQREVWRTYRPGQEVTKDPSTEYLKAAQAAIDAVRLVESPTPEPQKAPRVFSAGDIVLIRRLYPDNAREREIDWFAAGTVIGYNLVDYVLVDWGVPGSPYPCPEERLTRYEGVVSLWRLGDAVSCDRPDCQPKRSDRPFQCRICEARSQPHWWYVGHMADGPRKPRWPDAVWFPANYDPNTRSFE